MTDPHALLLEQALAADPRGVRELVAVLLPVIRSRATLGLRRRARYERRGRDSDQECDDLTQEVLAALFAERGRVLRNWDPTRGLSLKNYVGLVAARQVSAILRTGRRSPWPDEPAPDSQLARMTESVAAPEAEIGARELFDRILERLQEEVSPRGMMIFRALLVEERAIDAVCSDFEMTHEAAYTWRSRLLRRARELAEEIQALHTPRPATAKAEVEPVKGALR